jgi:intracellular sulfur oxidation DsrE/DsrF family protein
MGESDLGVEGGIMKNASVLAACWLAVLSVAPPLWGEGPPDTGNAVGRHRVVMHLNSGDEKTQRGALNNIRHLYQEVGRERLQVELVVHGAGLGLLMKKTTAFASELTALKTDYGVEYTACSNTMKAMNVTRDDLIAEVGDAAPAMVRLMERQEQGWTYIKP